MKHITILLISHVYYIKSENTKGVIKNGQSRETGNKTKEKKQKHNTIFNFWSGLWFAYSNDFLA